MNTPAWAVLTGIPHMPNAACKGEDPWYWTIPKGAKTTRDLTPANHEALRMCAACPTRRQCHQLPGMIREDMILGGVAYGSPTKNGQPRPITTAERTAA